ncbi:hypothetical protein D047_4040B, partial [Vibrio parahaemolyticus VPTS-2010_2]
DPHPYEWHYWCGVAA